MQAPEPELDMGDSVDLMELVFEDLWTSGYLAFGNYTCCFSCGVAEIENEYKRWPKGLKPKHTVWFHWQSTEKAINGKGLILYWGTFARKKKNESDDMVVQRTVAPILKALSSHGFTYDWDGAGDNAILVTNFSCTTSDEKLGRLNFNHHLST